MEFCGRIPVQDCSRTQWWLIIFDRRGAKKIKLKQCESEKKLSRWQKQAHLGPRLAGSPAGTPRSLSSVSYYPMSSSGAASSLRKLSRITGPSKRIRRTWTSLTSRHSLTATPPNSFRSIFFFCSERLNFIEKSLSWNTFLFQLSYNFLRFFSPTSIQFTFWIRHTSWSRGMREK